MRRNTGIKIALVAATVALSGLGLGLTGGPDADAADVVPRPVVAIDRTDLPPSIDHKDVNCPNDDRGTGTVEPTSGHGV